MIMHAIQAFDAWALIHPNLAVVCIVLIIMKWID